MRDPKQKAEAAVRAVKSGRADAELIERLQQLDWETVPFVTIVSDSQNAAVMLEVERIIASAGLDCLSVEGQKMIAGFLYGFQMGHDYAIKYGPLYVGNDAH